MAVTALRAPDPERIRDLVVAANQSVGRASELPMAGVGGELPALVTDLAALESQVTCLKLAALAEADDRKLAEQAAATGTDAWAAMLTGSTRAVMAGGLRLARLLEETYHATRDAFATGAINQDQARVIVRAGEHLPAAITPEQRQDCEAHLVAKAVDGMNAKSLRHASRRMAAVISAELADEQEADMLAGEERRAARETFFSMHDNGDGTHSGKFTIPDLHAAMLREFLDGLTAPRRWSRNNNGEPVADPTADQVVNIYERRGVAFCGLIEHLPTTGLGSHVADIVIHLDYEHLLDGLASAGLDTGIRISPAEVRRMACTAGLIPAVFGNDGEILDLGRRQRLFTAAQRRALSAAYHQCAVEGCDRPFSWCELHHKTPWSHGGPTDLDNAIPLCFYHHQRAHDPRFKISYLPTGEARYHRRR